MYLIAYLYLITGVIYICIELFYILKKKRIECISAFRIMYAFSYGFFPAIMCYRKFLGNSSVVEFNDSFIPSLYIILFISIIEYFIFSFSYKYTRKSKKFNKSYKFIPYDNLKISGIILIIVAFISIILWSRAFGSVWNFILQADAIRARYSTIYNPFAFLEHFTKIVFFTTFLFLGLYMHQKGLLNKIFNLTFFSISLLGSFLIILMTDGRGIIIVLIMVISFYILNDRLSKGKNIKLEIIKLAIICVCAFMILLFMEPLLWYIRFGEFKIVSTSNVFEIIEKEFSYILTTRKVALDTCYNMNLNYKIFDEIINCLTAWIPSRFVPFTPPSGLWDYNTLLISNAFITSGQSPTDFVSASIYMFGLSGIFILPFVWGVVLKKIETFLHRSKNNYYLDIIYCIILQRMIQLPTHFSLYNHFLLLFYVFLGHLIVSIISNIKSNTKKGDTYV